MSVPIEARSLSGLNYLLANPPQYPRNPTHEVLKPLVLYIVRVPGSKDVVLTPLKPPTKASITLEAIQTSLYYLHVHTQDDEVVIQSVRDERADTVETENQVPAIQRKPLPSVPYANYPPSQRPVPPPKSYPHYQPSLAGRTDATQIERYTARGSVVRFNSEQGVSQAGVVRKPVGPRKFTGLSRADGTISSDFHPAFLDPRTLQGGHDTCDSLEEERPNLPPRPPTWSNDSASFTQIHNLARNSTSSGDSPQSPGRTLWADPSRLQSRQSLVTIIRRDPTSGAQWNIGTITVGGATLETTLRPVFIELKTPGYLKFCGLQDIVRPGDPADADSIKKAIANADNESTAAMSMVEDAFTRSVEFRRQPLVHGPLRFQARTNSADSIPNFPIQNKPPKSVFSFLSPWQGLCSFSNGIDGRSLKCRHTVSSSSSTLEEDQTTASVAEVRFNLARSPSSFARDESKRGSIDLAGPHTLPISKLLKDPPSGKVALRKGFQHVKNLSKDLKSLRVNDRDRNHDHLENHMSPDGGMSLQREASQLSMEEDVLGERDPNRISLKLGREKAGGGYRGNSAKLGKIIIENEGLKMGDLVVAACMGVWWQHYDRHET